MGAMLLLNFGVYLLWQLEVPQVDGFMARHFLVSWSALEAGRWWTLLGSVFSHASFFHLLLNMFFLYGFGGALEQTLGQRRFWIFYISAGICGSLGHVLTAQFMLHRPELPALGASGALAGVLVWFAFLFPRERVYLLGLWPVPALGAMIMFLALDTWGLWEQGQGKGLPVGYGAHLGGALFGLMSFAVHHFRWRQELTGPQE